MKKKAEKGKKRSSKNLKINTRIVITSVLAIIIPIIIIASFSTVFIQTISSYFNFSSVTTNTYSTVNHIQWSQTLWSITAELSAQDETEDEKRENIKSFVSPLEEMGSLIYIENGDGVFYATESAGDIPAQANEIVAFENGENLNYFGNNGLVIVNHVKAAGASYTVIIMNADYTVNDVSQKLSFKEFTNLLLGRTGIIVLIIVALFAAAIAVTSFITSKTIVKPIKKIAVGANEIARGNLDYKIDYDSTNELGETVNSFNEMRLRLKRSIEAQNKQNEEQRELTAGIAHDLRTPLTSAKGYAEGLLDGIADTPEKKEQYIKTVCESINNTEKILDDLLTVSKLELNGYTLSPIDLNAKEFFDDGAEEVKQALEKAGFDFEYQCNCGGNAVIAIDPDRFARVIGNIISNSIKYTRSGVKGRVIFTVNEYERTVIIEITDNGIGVERDNLTKIFDTMYRTDPARTKVSSGSGLGLSICRRIVELHGGSIWASSAAGEGLSIFISLPKKEIKQNEQNSDN